MTTIRNIDLHLVRDKITQTHIDTVGVFGPVEKVWHVETRFLDDPDKPREHSQRFLIAQVAGGEYILFDHLNTQPFRCSETSAISRELTSRVQSDGL